MYKFSNFSIFTPMLLSSIPLIIAILKSVVWCLILLICISLMINDIEHTLKISISLFGKISTQVQFSSVTQSCPTLWDPMNHSTPGFPVHHQLLESTQTHVHWVGDAIQPSHPLLSPSPPALNLSEHQGLFKWVSSSQQVGKVLEFILIFSTELQMFFTYYVYEHLIRYMVSKYILSSHRLISLILCADTFSLM